MYFSMPCPHCQKNLKVRDELVGRTARCPHCRGAIKVQRPAADDEDEDEDAPQQDTSEQSSEQSSQQEDEENPFDSLGSLASLANASPSPAPTGRRTAATGKPEKKDGETPKPAPPAQAKPVSPKHPSAGGAAAAQVLAETGNTDVSVLLYMLAGFVGTGIFYAAIYPFAWNNGKLTYLGRLFIGASSMSEGGWVPIAEVFVFCWAIGMLIAKYFKIRRQQRAMLLDVLPVDIGKKINAGNLDAFLQSIGQLPKDAVGSFLVTRCIRGLEHFRARKSAADTATMLASQSDLDASSVDSSYTMFHVFIWAIPILGFLGTVIGVSAAVGGFTGTLENSSDIGALKEGLKSITSGLGTAFDTTLVALSMAMILTFPVSALQKLEGDVIGQVDEYTNEYLLRRLEDHRGGPEHAGAVPSQADIRQVVEAALATHRAELASWSEQLKSLGGAIAGDLQESWRAIDARQMERLTETEASLTTFMVQLGAVGEQLSRRVEEGWDAVNAKLAADRGRQVDQQTEQIGHLNALLENGRAELNAIAVDSEAARDRAMQVMATAAENVHAYTSTLERGLTGLAAVLERLGDRTIVVESHARPWWPFGSRAGKTRTTDPNA